MALRDRGLEIKTPDQIELMRAAGIVVGETLELVRSSAKAGMTTRELDQIAEAFIRDQGAIPSFQGVPGPPGAPDFPASLCLSVNEEVVHGIPGDRVLADGDIVSVDCGAIVEGWHGDAAVTIGIGETSAPASELMAVCEESLWRGMAAARLGGHVTDISHAIETYVRGQGPWGVLEDYVGHGIGSSMHMPPNVPNYGRPGKGPRLVRGVALAVEPMITAGTIDTAVLDDDWTVVTDDGSLAAHFEHTFTLTDTGIWVLTALDGGQRRLAELGAPYGGH
uniref:Methionine aminopeptidase n=1 Tax=uncultured Nocardioidaceae bacterium TaxID=253824 RepID=A0A6J4KPI7_9ACTN|nr:MAG: Methionine aminopeptidase [uncultured Nocardioidaceae bacterium]